MTTSKKQWVYVLAILAMLEFLPDSSFLTYPKRTFDMIHRFENEAIGELRVAKDYLGTENATAVFLGYDMDPNAFLASTLNSSLETISYTGQGDKAISVAYQYTPQSIKNLQCLTDVEQLTSLISRIAQYRICDIVVFPYFAMREQSYYWPPSDSLRNRLANIAGQVRDNLSGFPCLELDHYMIFDLRSDSDPGEVKKENVELREAPYTATVTVDETIEGLYFYALAFYDGPQEDCSLSVDILDDCGNLIEQIPYGFSDESTVCRVEQEVTVPSGSRAVVVKMNAPPQGIVELKNVTISSVDWDRFFTSSFEESLLSVGFGQVESYSNVELNEETAEFNGEGFIALRNTGSSTFGNFAFSMDLRVDDPISFSNAVLISKWIHWKNNMSFAFGLKETKSFITITEDGVSSNEIWFDNNLLDDGGWHHVSFEFDHGKGELWIDNQCIAEREYPFYRIYNSNETVVVIGSGFVGAIADFSITYDNSLET